MKHLKHLVFLCVFLQGIVWGEPLQEHMLDLDTIRPLLELFEITPQDDVVAATQRLWLRKKGAELWEIDMLDAKKRSCIMDWVHGTSLFSEYVPSQKSYDVLLIFGANSSRMERRIDYAVRLWNEGVRFHQVVFLTGQRPLDSRVDRKMQGIETESEMAVWLWNHLDIPQQMLRLPVDFVQVAMHSEVGGKVRRPNTADTIESWLEQGEREGSALFISDQPFCGTQYAITASICPDSISFDVAGPGMTDADLKHPLAPSVILDTLGRWLYQQQTNALSKVCPGMEKR